MAETFEWFLGIDWGSEAHEICLLDAQGRLRGTRTVAHTALAIHEAVQGVREQTGAAPAAIAVGLETPRGMVVDTVIEGGFSVFAVHPKQLDRFRDRFTAAGAKDDQVRPDDPSGMPTSWPMRCAPIDGPFARGWDGSVAVKVERSGS